MTTAVRPRGGIMAAIAAVAALGSSVPAPPSSRRRQAPPIVSLSMRETRRGSKPYVRKDGHSRMDILRLAKAEAKRSRKAQLRRAV